MTSAPRFPTLRAAAAILLMVTGIAMAQEKMPAADIAQMNPLAKLDPLSFDAFLKRPLFSADRRAPEEVVQQENASDTPLASRLEIRLLGVVVTPEGTTAHILDQGDKQSHSLRQGESYQGWRVVSIEGSALRLNKDRETLSLTLFAKPLLDDPSSIRFDASLNDAINKEDAPTQSAMPTASNDAATRANIGQNATAVKGQQALIDFFGPSAKPGSAETVK